MKDYSIQTRLCCTRGRPAPYAEEMVRIVRTFLRALTLACPNCGGRGLFRGYFNMKHRCPTCNLNFDRNPGSYIGGIGLNTVFSFFVLAMAVIVTFVVTPDDTPLWQLLIFPLAIALIVPLVFFPFSKSLWVSFEYLASPPRAEDFASKANEDTPSRGDASPSSNKTKTEPPAGGSH